MSDPAVQIVVELIGGTGVAGDCVKAALQAGKHVVTANKSLLAAAGPELFRLARANKVCIGFEASCGGGIPIISALTHGLIANRVDALVGIVNGTCNFILTQMSKNGWSYGRALGEAQRLGFAEADPTLDVNGRDAAQKLAVLAGLAFGSAISETDIRVEGIDTLQDRDINLAHELGYEIKLLAIGERTAGGLALRVHPTLVHKDDVLADVSGSFNAISVYGSAVGHTLFYGRGAGRLPTASAVISDLVGIALGTTPLAFERLNVFSDSAGPVRSLPIEEWSSRFYLRVTARDEPGVLADITELLGDRGISLSAVLQHESSDENAVPIVITTHLAREDAIEHVLKKLDVLPAVTAKTVCLRIMEPPTEYADLPVA